MEGIDERTPTPVRPTPQWVYDTILNLYEGGRKLPMVGRKSSGTGKERRELPDMRPKLYPGASWDLTRVATVKGKCRNRASKASSFGSSNET